MKNSTKTAFKYGGAIALLLSATFFLAWFRALDTKPVVDLNGMEFSFPSGQKANLEGKTTVVYFWATWCGVCSNSLPLVKWYASLLEGRESFAFISVEEGDNPSLLNQYLQKKEIQFPVIQGNPILLRDWGIGGYPTFYILDSHGKVRFAESGIMSPFGLALRLFSARFFWSHSPGSTESVSQP
ncbi:thiol-disulfide isomerase [Leptospira perolatii]|uniref:Thiol-disulfide isomerase n=1 Tax=Leptospira perolatii TaxID=2023191 RepID=A0A2M9ZLX7_9LEPT|nr:redoxin family protein [Leptospira perolatii]PJZ69766.1 thiol-disulfide isomerase [Leptospira perolatii]PJZ73019.1 thiol-disulfide isomerase [Leptospira perolatii]